MIFSHHIDRLVTRPVKWLAASNTLPCIAFSSRIRLARNIGGFPFPHCAGEQERTQIFDRVSKSMLESLGINDPLNQELLQVGSLNRQILFERQLISREQKDPLPGNGLFVGEEEQYSVAVNEEDHLRIQVLQPGFSLLESWEIIDDIECKLGKLLQFVYDKNIGYLTSCPTNVGTGLRASVMVHLPALVFNNQIKAFINSLSQMKCTVRGFYGEGSDSIGNLFQISNQSTLGENETTIIHKLKKVIVRTIEHETNARSCLLENQCNELCDYIARAYGLLSYAYNLNSKEAMSYLSAVRLGIELGMITNLQVETLNQLTIEIQSGHLQKIHNKILSAKERDILRAEIIRSTLKKPV